MSGNGEGERQVGQTGAARKAGEHTTAAPQLQPGYPVVRFSVRSGSRRDQLEQSLIEPERMRRKHANLSRSRVARIDQTIVFLWYDDRRNAKPEERAIINPHIAKFRFPLGRRILLPITRRKLRRFDLRADVSVIGKVNLDGDQITWREQRLDVNEILEGRERQSR
jgi:hypothetical protein